MCVGLDRMQAELLARLGFCLGDQLNKWSRFCTISEQAKQVFKGTWWCFGDDGGAEAEICFFIHSCHYYLVLPREPIQLLPTDVPGSYQLLPAGEVQCLLGGNM